MVAATLVVAGLLWWNPSSLPRAKVRTDKNESLLAVSEGSHGIVAVVEQPGSRRLKLDNFYVLGGTASVGDERMQAHLPLLLHPMPKRVAFLGLGTGITAGGALLHPIERITALEIVPEVVTAARTHFAEANLGIVGAARSEVVVDDARGFLRQSGRQFDVIVGDLVVPWRRGESALYSAEHFAATRRALAPGGLFCQWLPMFQLSEEEFRIVAATFLDVVPRASLWRGDFAPDHPVLALVGHVDASAAIDPATVARRVREITMDPSNPQLTHEAALWIYLVGPLEARARNSHRPGAIARIGPGWSCSRRWRTPAAEANVRCSSAANWSAAWPKSAAHPPPAPRSRSSPANSSAGAMLEANWPKRRCSPGKAGARRASPACGPRRSGCPPKSSAPSSRMRRLTNNFGLFKG